MLRAINTTTFSCCKTIMLQNNKASLSTLSFNPSLFNCNSNSTQSYHFDLSRISAVQSPPSALTSISSTVNKTYKQITSQISNYLTATLSGDLTFLTIDNKPDCATLVRRRVFSAASRKSFTAMLLPVESTFDVVAPVFEARLAVACRATLDTGCCGAGAKAVAVDTMKAVIGDRVKQSISISCVIFVSYQML